MFSNGFLLARSAFFAFTHCRNCRCTMIEYKYCATHVTFLGFFEQNETIRSVSKLIIRRCCRSKYYKIN